MDERDWVLISTIYDYQSISKAAEALYTSQPAISYRIKQMEAELSVKIAWKSKKGIQFTAEGEYLVKYAKKMLIELQKTKDYLKNINNHIEGIIRLGVSSNFAQHQLPNLMKRFLENYDDVQFNVITSWSSDIFKLLMNEEIHMAIVTGDYAWEEQKVLINEESLCIINNKPFEIIDLPNMSRISYRTSPHINKNNNKKDRLIKQIIESWWQERFSVPPIVTMEVDNVNTCKEMVKHGLGYAIIPSTCINPQDEYHKLIITGTDDQTITRKTWLLYREEAKQFPVLCAFIDFIRT